MLEDEGSDMGMNKGIGCGGWGAVELESPAPQAGWEEIVLDLLSFSNNRIALLSLSLSLRRAPRCLIARPPAMSKAAAAAARGIAYAATGVGRPDDRRLLESTNTGPFGVYLTVEFLCNSPSVVLGRGMAELPVVWA